MCALVSLSGYVQPIWARLDDLRQSLWGLRICGLRIHDYIYFPDTIPSVGFSDNQYYNVVHRANQGQIGPRIEEVKAILDEHDPGNRTKIFLDEWGDWFVAFNESQDTWLQQITVLDAISSAEQLHLFMRHADRIFMAAVAQPINVIHSLFLTRQSDGALVKTPAFYVFKMFVPHHTSAAMWAPHTLDSENITGNNTTFPVLSAGTSVDSAGRVNVSLANVDLVNSRTLEITLNGGASSYNVDLGHLAFEERRHARPGAAIAVARDPTSRAESRFGLQRNRACLKKSPARSRSSRALPCARPNARR